jgi:hypothetical protein
MRTASSVATSLERVQFATKWAIWAPEFDLDDHAKPSLAAGEMTTGRGSQ